MENDPAIAARIDALSSAAKHRRVITTSSVMIGGMLPELISKSGEMLGVIHRDVLPEPWDLPDHIGNFNEAALYTTFVFSAVGAVLSRKKPETPEKNTMYATAAAFVISSAIQLLGEKYGKSLGLPNHDDMIDAAYGVGFTLISLMGLRKGYKWASRPLEKYIDQIEEQAQKPQLLTDHLPSSAPSKQQIPRVNSKIKKGKRKQQQASRKRNR